MDNTQNPIPRKEPLDPLYDICSTASTTECTGLVPAGIEQEAEAEAYGELYDIHPPTSPDNRPHKTRS